MEIRVKELLKTDSIAGSRIVINSNFNTVVDAVNQLSSFFDIDENRITIDSISTDTMYTKYIKSENSLEIYQNDILCAKFNSNGELLIRKDSDCNLNVNQALTDSGGSGIDFNTLANSVKVLLKQDTDFTNNLKTTISSTILQDNTFLTNLSTNQTLVNALGHNEHLASWISSSGNFIFEVGFQVATNTNFQNTIKETIEGDTVFINSLVSTVKSDLSSDDTFVTTVVNGLINNTTFMNAIISEISENLQKTIEETMLNVDDNYIVSFASKYSRPNSSDPNSYDDPCLITSDSIGWWMEKHCSNFVPQT